MSELRVRTYNVGFGDAILVSIPDRSPATGEETLRHLLIDVGNVLAGSGGADDLFRPVVEDIASELNGQPADLYLMTHEHMDHVQGLLWAKKNNVADIRANFVWLTASSEPGYYDQFPNAKQKKLDFTSVYDQLQSYFAAGGEQPEAMQALMLNNNPRSTADCVSHLRALGPKAAYVFRGCDVSHCNPFEEAQFSILAPEQDCSIYYGSAHGFAFGVVEPGPEGGKASLQSPVPPPGVDAGAFYNLVERRRNGSLNSIFEIDKAANNSSVVFLLEWRGWKLLFPADAELASWRTMAREGVLPENIHFLKVGHHGSSNGTPVGTLLDRLLPPDETAAGRSAVVSTCEKVYNGVPDSDTLDVLRQRVTLHEIGQPGSPLFIDVVFPG